MNQPDTPLQPEIEPELRQRHVLLADDQVINAMIVSKWLGMLGCTMERVEDGQQAVERWRQRRFDLILMDVKMPVMDGLEATARIRELEASGATHTPIVALTASVSAKELDACLTAGMDGHTTKPVTLDSLAAAMRAALRSAIPATAAAKAKPRTIAPAPMPDWAPDLDQLRQNLGDDEELLQEYIAAMRLELGQRLQRLQAAALASDAGPAQEQAHALRGALGSLGAEAAAALTRALESAAGAGDWNACQQALERLQAQVSAIQSALAVIR